MPAFITTLAGVAESFFDPERVTAAFSARTARFRVRRFNGVDNQAFVTAETRKPSLDARRKARGLTRRPPQINRRIHALSSFL